MTLYHYHMRMRIALREDGLIQSVFTVREVLLILNKSNKAREFL